MANWNTKITKAAAGELQPGEDVIAGVFLQPAGTMGQAVGQGAGGVLGRAIVAKRGEAASADEDPTGLAGDFANEPTVLGLTRHRLLVFGYSSFGGKPKGLRQAMPATVLSSIAIEKQKATYRFEITFHDGSSKMFEAPRIGNDPETFAALVNRR